MADEIDRIVAGLTKAQREAVLRQSLEPQSWDDWLWSDYEEPLRWKTEGRALRDHGLVTFESDPRSSRTVLTETGLAVRARLVGESE